MSDYKRPKHSELSPEARKKANCRAYTNELIRRGKLTRGPCEDCGSTEKVQPHHDDYDDPRNVRWKCADCHWKHHHSGPSKRGLTCSMCDGPGDRPGQGLCRACHAIYMRDWRKREKAKAEADRAELQRLRGMTRAS